MSSGTVRCNFVLTKDVRRFSSPIQWYERMNGTKRRDPASERMCRRALFADRKN